MKASEFLNALALHSVVSAPEIETFRETLLPGQLAADAEAVAKELVRQQRLTKYQAAHVYKGRTKALVFGEYIVLDKLGAGGMGQVFKAQHRRMKRIVALKVLPAQATNSASAVSRFYQEVEMAARLSHPNIVTAYDAGEAHKLHYLAMEFVDGKDLSYVVTRSGPLSVDQAMYCLSQSARGLHYAHQQGIIHRDVKPSNLLVDRRSVVKILDMGLARFNDSFGRPDDGSGLTEAGQVLGTVDYMAPEQAHDARSADHRADIYGLGCTLFRLLTDRVPYPADTVLKKILAHREQPIPSLRNLRPEVPPRLEQLYQRMLAKDPAQRIESMAEVSSTLDALLAGKSDEASSVSVLDDPVVEEDLRSFLKSGQGLVGSSIGQNTHVAAEAAGLSGISNLTSPSSASRRRIAERQANKAGQGTGGVRAGLLGGTAAAVLVLFLAAMWLLFAGGLPPKERPGPPQPKKEIATVNPSAALSKAAFPVSASSKLASVGPSVSKPSPMEPVTAPAAPPPSMPAVGAAPAASPAPRVTESPPSARSSRPVVKALTAPVDLLKILDTRHGSTGKWSIGPNDLVRLPSGEFNTRITIPFAPPADYDLTLTAEGPLEKNEICVGLIVGGARTNVVFCPHGDVAQINMGMADAKIRELARRPVAVNSSNVNRTTLTYSVRGPRVCVRSDGALLYDWSGDPATLVALSPSPMVGPSNWLSLNIVGATGEVRISKLEIAPPKAELPSYSRVDLLALYDPGGDGAPGVSIEQQELRLQAISNAAATVAGIAVPTPSQYTLAMVIERTAGRSELELGLPIGNRLGMSAIGGDGAYLNGFDIPGEKKRVVLPWRFHIVTWTIGAEHTSLRVDGSAIVDQARSSYTMGGDWRRYGPQPTAQAFYFRVVADAAYRISGLELTPAQWRKHPPPRTEALTAARETLNREAGAPAVTSQQKREAAQNSWRRAARLLEDDAARYVSLETAATLAANAGDLPLACRAASDLARTFAGDYSDLFARLVGDSFRGAKTPANRKQLADEALRQIELAVAWEQFDLAAELQQAALAITKPPTSDLAKELKARGIELQFDRDAAARFREAETTIDGGQSDARAHADIGRYLGLVRNDWSAARSEFEQAGETSLRDLARAEAGYPRSPARQMELADQWWAWADKSEPPLKALAVERALAWSMRADAGGAKDAKTAVTQHKQAILQQRRSSNLAFALRHPPDAVKVGNSWFKVYKSAVTWKTAAQICEEAGGALPIIDGPVKNQTVAQVLTALLPNDVKTQCWLGLTDENKEGQWQWANGSLLTSASFVSWGVREPDNNGGNQNYARLEVLPGSGQFDVRWYDEAEGSGMPVLCEWQQ